MFNVNHLYCTLYFCSQSKNLKSRNFLLFYPFQHLCLDISKAPQISERGSSESTPYHPSSSTSQKPRSQFTT